MTRHHKYRVAYKTDYHHDREESGEFWVVSQSFHLQDLQPGGAVTQFDFSDGSYLGLDDVDWRELVWMQWTGLVDKNGVEIYEKDVIKHSSGRTQTVKMTMEWNCGCCCGVYGWIFDHEEDHKTHEVIGNTLEHPELAKEANE